VLKINKNVENTDQKVSISNLEISKIQEKIRGEYEMKIRDLE